MATADLVLQYRAREGAILFSSPDAVLPAYSEGVLRAAVLAEFKLEASPKMIMAWAPGASPTGTWRALWLLLCISLTR